GYVVMENITLESEYTLHADQGMHNHLSLCSRNLWHLRSSADRLQRQWPYPRGCEQWPCLCAWKFDNYHLITSKRDSQPGLFGVTQWFGRHGALYVVRHAGTSCQSLVEYGNRSDHWHTDYAGHHVAHIFLARQLEPFSNRSTNSQHHDHDGPSRVDDYHDVTCGRNSRSSLQPRCPGEWRDAAAHLEPRRRGRDTPGRPQFEFDNRRDCRHPDDGRHLVVHRAGSRRRRTIGHASAVDYDQSARPTNRPADDPPRRTTRGETRARLEARGASA